MDAKDPFKGCLSSVALNLLRAHIFYGLGIYFTMIFFYFGIQTVLNMK